MIVLCTVLAKPNACCTVLLSLSVLGTPLGTIWCNGKVVKLEGVSKVDMGKLLAVLKEFTSSVCSLSTDRATQSMPLDLQIIQHTLLGLFLALFNHLKVVTFAMIVILWGLWGSVHFIHLSHLFCCHSLPQSPSDDIPDEERDRRTVFCMQLSQRVGVKELEDFLSQAGKVGAHWGLCVAGVLLAKVTD